MDHDSAVAEVLKAMAGHMPDGRRAARDLAREHGLDERKLYLGATELAWKKEVAKAKRKVRESLARKRPARASRPRRSAPKARKAKG